LQSRFVHPELRKERHGIALVIVITILFPPILLFGFFIVNPREERSYCDSESMSERSPARIRWSRGRAAGGDYDSRFDAHMTARRSSSENGSDSNQRGGGLSGPRYAKAALSE
jgi:hypothetical protein